MNLTLSSVEQKIVSAFKGQYETLTSDAKAEIHTVVKADLGLLAAHPWYYTLGCYVAGIVTAIVAPIVWHAL